MSTRALNPKTICLDARRARDPEPLTISICALLIRALGLRAEPVTQRGVFRVEKIVVDREDRASERAPQHRFDPAEKERELALVLRELAEAP